MMLVRTPFHKPNESLIGYALRLSETNGYETPWHILRLARIEQSTMTNAAFPVAKLALILGRNPDQLRNIAYMSNSGGQSHFEILGHHLGDGLGASPLRLQRPAICPECVSNRGYIEAFFDLSLAVACPLHGRELLSKCERCGNRLSHFRPGLLICRCGASLEEQIPPPVSDRIIGLMTALKVVLERVEFPSSASDVGLPIGELRSTPLRWMLTSLPKFGRFNRPNYPVHSLEVVDGIAEALENWPHGFHCFLERYCQSKEAPTFHQRFTKFSEIFFRRTQAHVKCDWLYSEFLQYGITQARDSFVDQRAIPGRSQERRVIPLRELARRTGHDIRTLAAWGKKGLLDIGSMRSGSGRRYLVDTNALTRPARAEIERRLGKREAAAWLGIPVSVLDCLRNLGQFPLLHHLASQYGFHETDLLTFRRRMLALSPQISELTSPNEVISLQDLLRTSRLHSTEHKTQLLIAFLTGELTSVGRTGESLDQIFFDRGTIAALAVASRCVIAKGALTHRQAAQIIGCDQLVISGLLENNFVKNVARGKTTRVDENSVALFAKKYAPLARCAEDWATSSAHLKQLCNRAKIGMLDIVHHENSRSPFIEHHKIPSLYEVFVDDRRARAAPATKELRPDPADQVREYLQDLRARDQPLPWHGGNVNKIAIARACGFDRDVFYTNEAAIRLLHTAVREERLRRIASGEPVDPPLARLKNYLDRLRRNGESLPMWQLKPNRSAIAKNASVDRDLLSNRDTARRMLESFLKKPKPR
ncbi:TniQ protein [Paraburkholderia fungorum]|uniref:TniQ protein n=1 Tax=Paraburkholderia fungorum TaxID=134537 RepID=A0A1H1HQW3_9BURK|nr:TniQ family protein [Paraburkholderia fungorum]SDR27803.1 TniQ protein [Paraburkholderia fungorum]